MKRLSLIILTLFCIVFHSTAQNCFNIFQDNIVLKKIPTSQVDSITVSETTPHIVSFWRNGSVLQSYNTGEIDCITVTSDEDPLTYMGIVGFNNDLYKKEVDVLATSTANSYRSFVSSLPRKDGTLLYYAVDNATDMLDNAKISTPLSSIHLVTFTDGLDQGSIMMNSRYSSSKEYLNAMSNLIRKGKYKGLPVNGYSVGLRGNDVSDIPTFQNNLSLLASSANKSFEVNSVSDLQSTFQDIANQIISICIRHTVSLKIPGIDSGTRVRFIFDGQPAESSSLYIEGTFNLGDRTLRNVTYHGMTARSGSVVQGTQDGIFVTFTFMGLQRADASQVIPTNNIKHYYRLPSSSSWQLNSEFTTDNNTQRYVSHSGALIVLVLDCSSSLGSDFAKVQQYANEFIDMIANNAQPFSLKAPENAKAVLDDVNFNIVVSWDAVKHAESYQVYRSGSSNGSYTLVADKVTSTTWTDRAPLSGSNYYRIKAIGHGQSSDYSQTYLNYALDAPTNVKAVLDDVNFNIVVSWGAVKHAESYQVYRSGSSNGSYTLVADKVTSTTWTDNAPLGGNYYRIKAVGNGLISDFSSTTDVVKVDRSGTINGRAYVDLGLPSGTLWATCNIGATSPEDYGDYFAWGETKGYNSGKTTFNWSTYKWCEGSSSTMTKYCTQSSYGYNGFTDNKTELDPEDDAAYVLWGSDWRMPSYEQCEELINSSYTTTEWTTMNGVKGRKITSKTNGNFIFLPAAGYRRDAPFDGAGSYGSYWSRTLCSDYPSYARSLYFHSSNVYMSNDYRRCYGQSVRPVRSTE